MAEADVLYRHGNGATTTPIPHACALAVPGHKGPVDVGLGTTYVHIAWCDAHRCIVGARDPDLLLEVRPYLTDRRQFGPGRTLEAIFGRSGVDYDIGTDIFDPPRGGSPNMLFGLGDRNVWVLNVKSGDSKVLVRKRTLPNTAIVDVAWSPDGSKFVVAAENDRIRLEDPNTMAVFLWLVRANGHIIRRLGLGFRPHWTPDGRSIVAISGQGSQVRLFDLYAHKSRVLCQTSLEAYYDCAISPDGSTVAVCGALTGDGGGPAGVFTVDRAGAPRTVLATAAQLHMDMRYCRLAW